MNAPKQSPKQSPKRPPSDLKALEAMRHSLSHVLAMAVLEMFPEAKLGIGPATDDGFYYDFDLPRTLIPEDLPILEQKMRKIVKRNLTFEGKELPPKEAIDALKQAGQPYKVELAEEFASAKEPITFYTSGPFTDLCKGGHVKSTKQIGPFKLTRIAGAYWRGDENRPQLQRIYGVAFATQPELDAYLKRQEEAEQRDHRKLGKELDLFIHSDLVGGGLPLWTPRGTILRNELDKFVQSLRDEYGYQEVAIPHISKKDLYEKSGHWSKFANELYRVHSREGDDYALKPMNCPHHTQLYADRPRSYRELPVRYRETTAVYRDEQSGEVSGLSRVRALTQDDAHVFCRQDQIQAEILAIWDIVERFYAAFDLPLTVRFSRHEPSELDAHLGTEPVWKAAEAQLKKVIEGKAGKRVGVDYIDGPGEAALYGPKIDFIAEDALGREHQVATIQLDFNLPENFDLTCIAEDGKEERIVMIHAAIMGSIERFLSVLIEHLAGVFPLWLAPEQVRVLTISQKQAKYAEEVAAALREAGLRATVDADAETIGKKIRNAETMKIPYMLVVGDKEKQAGSVAIRSYREGDLGTKQLAAVAKQLAAESAGRS
ncbi:MAG: threonine--tRNA ligase [Patescibacteria group bacterium]|nr:threonine--tRNA ligase [Patescibacteria group bacterium]